jgi:predicted RNase H-like HicB family nuclease/uncharacterized damage-inducible protein DinB
MVYHLAEEDMEPNHWIAWVLDLPACFSPAKTRDEAIAQAPQVINQYYAWLASHNSALPIPAEIIETEVVESFLSFPSQKDPEYIVNALFNDDRRPLGYWEVEVASRLLTWTRQDLQAVLSPVDMKDLNKSIPGESHGSIAGILRHVAIAENWYFSHIGLALERGQIPEDPLGKLQAVRTNTHKQLIKLVGNEQITENYNEQWSARKVLRRTLWHERDHTQHIAKLLAGS